MRQRLGVARSLLADPALLILDEPTNRPDPAGILDFRGMVRTLVAEGRTVVLSSHLLDEVEKICDLVAVLDHAVSSPKARSTTSQPLARSVSSSPLPPISKPQPPFASPVSQPCRSG